MARQRFSRAPSATSYFGAFDLPLLGRAQRAQRAGRHRRRTAAWGIDATTIARGLQDVSRASSGGSKIVGRAGGVTVYDDFAHHPTAVAETLRAVRAGLSRAARVGRLRAAVGVVLPADLPARLRASASAVGRGRDAHRDRVPVDAAGGTSGCRWTNWSTTICARRPARASRRRRRHDRRHHHRRAARRRRRRDHVQWRVRRHSPQACRAAAAGRRGRLIETVAVRPRICRLGEETWLVEFEPRLDPADQRSRAGHGRARSASPEARRRARRRSGHRQPGGPRGSRASSMRTVLSRQHSTLAGRMCAVDRASRRVARRSRSATSGAFGPDLEAVARLERLLDVGGHRAPQRHPSIASSCSDSCPGFAYLGTVDESIAAPRRATPRLKVPAGSVGIAGRQTGVYPLESPGGWQIVGRTPIGMFDPTSPATRADAGRRPRAFRADRSGRVRSSGRVAGGRRSGERVQIVRPGMLTTVQDRGRWGFQRWGVPVSGPMDAWSARLANRLVGNADATALLEVTLRRPGVQRSTRDGWIAVTGARFRRRDRRPVHGARRSSPRDAARRARAVRKPADGARAYVGVRRRLGDAPDARQRVHASPSRAWAASTDARCGPATACRWARAGIGRRDERQIDSRLPTVPKPGTALHVMPRRTAGGSDDCDDGGRVATLCATTFIALRRIRIAWAIGLTGRQARWPRPQRSAVVIADGAGAMQLPAGGDADPADGRSTDDRRLRADRRVDSARRPPLAGQLAPGDRVAFRCHVVERRAARRIAAAKRALDALARGGARVSQDRRASESSSLAAASAPIASASTCRSRRSRRSRSAGPPTCSSSRGSSTRLLDRRPPRAAQHGVPRHDARRRLERADRRRRHPRPGRAARAAATSSAMDAGLASAPTPPSRSTASCAG